LKPVQFHLIAMQSLCACSSSADVFSNDNLPQPFEHGLGNNEGTQMPCEELCQLLFARVGLWTLTAVTGAMVVYVSSFLQFPDEGTSAMAAFQEARECEVVCYLPVFSRVATIENLLAAFPHFLAHQRLMNPLGRLCRRTRTRPYTRGSEASCAVSSPGFCSCSYETEIPLRRPSWRETSVSIH
jgi:hypothetical protein